MKKIALFSVVVLTLSFVSCENSNINEETSDLEELEIFNVDPDKIQRPGSQG